MLAVSLEDVWSGPARGGLRQDDQHINWRVEGTEGVAKGTIGWPTGAASTLTYASTKTTGGKWVDADLGHDVVPACLHRRDGAAAARRARPARRRRSSVADNVKTMALVEAGYRSIAEGRAVKLSEISIN